MRKLLEAFFTFFFSTSGFMKGLRDSDVLNLLQKGKEFTTVICGSSRSEFREPHWKRLCIA